MGKRRKKQAEISREAPSCDPGLFVKKGTGNTNRIYRYEGGFKWSRIRAERYKKESAGWSSIARHVLVGNNGESAKFHLRYFEIAPGGNSSLEYHKHEHAVVCIRGRGDVLIGRKTHTISYLDTVYIAPDTVHRLANPYDEPFGFFCIVNAKRDKPKQVVRNKTA